MLVYRRTLLTGAALLGTAAAMGGAATVARAALAPTPAQTEGPFYPNRRHVEEDNDLSRLAGQPAKGGLIEVRGRVLGPDGAPIAGARVEIWHADVNGRYRHPRDLWGSPRDPNFQGFGATNSDPAGNYRFRTIRPAPYGSRTPHIHFKVLASGLRPLTTQMYFAGHAMNRRDGILNAVRDPAERARLIVPFAAAPDLGPAAARGAFEIVLRQAAA